MKKKIVLKVFMKDDKSRSKALKIAVGISGVESAALSGAAKDEVVVEGEGIDAVTLTNKLRKSVGCTDVVSVGEVKKEAPAPPKAVTPVVWSYPPYPSYPVYEMVPPSTESCTIM